MVLIHALTTVGSTALCFVTAGSPYNFLSLSYTALNELRRIVLATQFNVSEKLTTHARSFAAELPLRSRKAVIVASTCGHHSVSPRSEYWVIWKRYTLKIEMLANLCMDEEGTHKKSDTHVQVQRQRNGCARDDKCCKISNVLRGLTLWSDGQCYLSKSMRYQRWSDLREATHTLSLRTLRCEVNLDLMMLMTSLQCAGSLSGGISWTLRSRKAFCKCEEEVRMARNG